MEAEEAFKQIKQLISELPMLVAPMEKEEHIVYLAVAKETVSAVLMTEWEAKQMPIYFVSRALRGSEVNYMSMEKLVLALVHASKHLKRYFQSALLALAAHASNPKEADRLKFLASCDGKDVYAEWIFASKRIHLDILKLSHQLSLHLEFSLQLLLYAYSLDYTPFPPPQR
ncbi:reverse transcriptase domain-containing protein [Tanacetum coccineum]|uniref:Reverse transcriptase domain-containing protein n=1 Tax=Tanacetum coccineum TaxID=301880 RepID=A0ABQ5EAK4_9ASTR